MNSRLVLISAAYMVTLVFNVTALAGNPPTAGQVANEMSHQTKISGKVKSATCDSMSTLKITASAPEAPEAPRQADIKPLRKTSTGVEAEFSFTRLLNNAPYVITPSLGPSECPTGSWSPASHTMPSQRHTVRPVAGQARPQTGAADVGRIIGGESGLAFTYSVPLPAAPAMVEVKGQGGRLMEIKWRDNSTNETAFHFQRKKKGGDWDYYGKTQIHSSSTGMTWAYLDDKNLLPNTEYCYRVIAYNNSLAQSSSGEMCGKTLKVDPTDVTFKSSTNNSVTIQWNDNETDIEKDYTILRSEKLTSGAPSPGHGAVLLGPVTVGSVGAHSGTGYLLYTDKKEVKADTQYCYQVVMHDSQNNEYKSSDAGSRINCGSTKKNPPVRVFLLHNSERKACAYLGTPPQCGPYAWNFTPVKVREDSDGQRLPFSVSASGAGGEKSCDRDNKCECWCQYRGQVDDLRRGRWSINGHEVDIARDGQSVTN